MVWPYQQTYALVKIGGIIVLQMDYRNGQLSFGHHFTYFSGFDTVSREVKESEITAQLLIDVEAIC